MTERDEQKDLRLLADAFYKELFFNDSCYGSPAVDDKRPFGNSDVRGDILEIIGWEAEGHDGYDFYTNEQNDYAWLLWEEKLIPYLKSCWKEYKNANP